MRATLFHALRWDGPNAFVEIDVCPPSGGCLDRAGHRVQLPFDQAAGRFFDGGVGDFQHELG